MYRNKKKEESSKGKITILHFKLNFNKYVCRVTLHKEYLDFQHNA